MKNFLPSALLEKKWCGDEANVVSTAVYNVFTHNLQESHTGGESTSHGGLVRVSFTPCAP